MDRETETYQTRNAQVIAMVHAYAGQSKYIGSRCIRVLSTYGCEPDIVACCSQFSRHHAANGRYHRNGIERKTITTREDLLEKEKRQYR